MGWQSIHIVGASARVIFILHHKIQKMAKCTSGTGSPGCPGQSPESHKMVVVVVMLTSVNYQPTLPATYV